MENLVQQLHILFGNYFVFYSKIHQFHWNVEGQNFHQYHEFYGNLYLEIWEEIDIIAEKIRQLNFYVTGNLTEIAQWSEIMPANINLSISEMNNNLLQDNLIIQKRLMNCFDCATEINDQALVNYFTGRLEYHKKLNWLLSSSL